MKYLSLFLFSMALMGATPATSPHAFALFAGGCFWCMEPPFDKLKGVVSTTAGYTGGDHDNPTYGDVSRGITGHAEAVKVEYDPSLISYEELLHTFWRNIDPTVRDRQFCDQGTQYRSAIFYSDAAQEKIARASLKKLQQRKPFAEPIVTEISAATTFYPAEEYHQDYYLKNKIRYNYYRYRCGRDERLKELWGGSAHE